MGSTVADRAWFGTALMLLGWGVAAWATDGLPSLRWSSSLQMLAIWLAAGLVVLGWSRWSVAAEQGARRWWVAPLTLAVTAPLALVPMVDFRGDLASTAGLVASTLAVVPLAVAIAAQTWDARLRRRTLLAVGGVTAAALAMAWLVGAMGDDRATRTARWLLVSAIALVPAAMVAAERLRPSDRSVAATQRRTLEAAGLLVIGALPGVAALALTMRGWPILLLPIAGALGAALVLGRYVLLPLARLATSATGQRDQVVAAAETERQRLAEALHDGPLAEMALLIQRLDHEGDGRSAAIARAVADELRALGSELRLPILDDLGTGPALEWLVGRISQRSGVPVQLHQSTQVRPPARVELAVYRVAQEALVNAVKHGGAPISVRYTATTERVELVVDDAGPGIGRDATARAEREGRQGLSSMSQRAETIGAQLLLVGPPHGGTQVRLEWVPT